MFAVLVPVSLSPLIITLFWAESKAKRMGLVEEALRHPSPASKVEVSFAQRAQDLAEQLDLLGLALLGASIALILLPLTLSQTAKNGWKTGTLSPFHNHRFDSIINGNLRCRFYHYHACDRRYPPFCIRHVGLSVCQTASHRVEVCQESKCGRGGLDRVL